MKHPPIYPSLISCSCRCCLNCHRVKAVVPSLQNGTMGLQLTESQDPRFRYILISVKTVLWVEMWGETCMNVFMDSILSFYQY